MKTSPAVTSRAGTSSTSKSSNSTGAVLFEPTHSAQAPLPDPVEVFRARCEARALLVAYGVLDLQGAVDGLQSVADAGLVDLIGPDQVQAIMSTAFTAVRDDDIEPLEIATKAGYRTAAQSTIDTFFHLVSLGDPARLKAWLADHAADAPTLLKLLDAKRCR